MALRVPCPQCGKFPPPPCDCPPLPPGPPDEPQETENLSPSPRTVVEIRREKRRGRAVIVIGNFSGDTDLGTTARELKETCASGGTVKGKSIEIQGDHREAIENYFARRGFKTKRTGG
jgi:translation initiation factor 1